MSSRNNDPSSIFVVVNSIFSVTQAMLAILNPLRSFPLFMGIYPIRFFPSLNALKDNSSDIAKLES